MLCNNKQTNKNKNSKCPPTPIPRHLTLANPPRVRSYLARATAGRVQWSTWQWYTWPIAGPQTLFVRREHTDSFRGYNLFTSSMQQRHPCRTQFYKLPLSRTYWRFDRRVVTPLTKGHIRPVTLLLLVLERERESRFGLAVRRSRRAAARFRFGFPFSSKKLWFVDTVL